MNTYRAKFWARCPNNGIVISYRLEIRLPSNCMLMVEDLQTHLWGIGEGYHEQIADALLARFGGSQTLVAEHHGVEIETHREVPA